MKRLTFILVSLMCFSCATKETPVAKYTGSDISDVILARIITDDPYNDESLFRQIHADEIKKTFTLNSVDTVGNLSVAFFSFSIGNESVKDVAFVNKLNGTFAISDPEEYGGFEIKDPDSLAAMEAIAEYYNDPDMYQPFNSEKKQKQLRTLADKYNINNSLSADRYNLLLIKATKWRDHTRIWWYENYIF